MMAIMLGLGIAMLAKYIKTPWQLKLDLIWSNLILLITCIL